MFSPPFCNLCRRCSDTYKKHYTCKTWIWDLEILIPHLYRWQKYCNAIEERYDKKPKNSRRNFQLRRNLFNLLFSTDTVTSSRMLQIIPAETLEISKAAFKKFQKLAAIISRRRTVWGKTTKERTWIRAKSKVDLRKKWQNPKTFQWKQLSILTRHVTTSVAFRENVLKK